MSGTVKQDTATGTWWFQFTIKVDGERKHVRRRGFRTKGIAEREMRKIQVGHDGGDRRAVQAPSTQPLGEYLDAWLQARRVAGDGLKPSTASSYAMCIRVYLAPLRSIPLRDLSGEQVSRWHAELRDHGGKIGKDGTRRPLSARTGAYAARVLAMALGDAVESGKLARSPFLDIAKRQRPTRHKQRQQLGRIWTPEQARTFLAAETVRADRLHPLWCLLLDSGARRGEALGLSWADVEAEHVTFRVNRVLVDDHVEEGTLKGGEPRRVKIDPRTAATLRR
jgi:integrase